MTTTDDRDIRGALARAALDAPRVDLWGRIEEQVREPRRSRWPGIGALRALAAALALLVVSGALLAIISLAGDGSRADEADELTSVPDLVLLHAWDQTGETTSLRTWLPGTSETRVLLDGLTTHDQPVVSPDGRQLVYSGWQTIDERVVVSIWALDTRTLAPDWSAELLSTSVPSDPYWPGIATSVAVSTERVFVATWAWESPDPPTVTALDRADGRRLGDWTIDFGELRANNLKLLAAPDGSGLLALADVTPLPYNPSSTDYRPALVMWTLPEMQEAWRSVPDAPVDPSEHFWVWDDRVTPDGRALYAVGVADLGDSLTIRFMDLETGAPGALVIPFSNDADPWLYERAVSHDGRLLYLFKPTNGDLAIVDLQARAVIGLHVVDLSRMQAGGESWLGQAWGLRGLFVQEAAAKVYIQGTMQLSPDGGRLYAVGMTGDAIAGEPRGVLVINTQTWQVEHHWLPELNPTQILLGGDGRYLYAQTFDWDNGGAGALRVIDTTSGAQVMESSDLASSQIYSPAELYRGTYGASPAIAGVDPSDLKRRALDGGVPFATLSASVSANSLVAGDAVTVEARFLQPDSGDLVHAGDDAVRYEPPDSIRAVLSNGREEEDVTVVLTPAGYGVYRGAARLAEPGTWTVRVFAEREGEPSRRVTLEDAVAVQPALRGSDGRRYILSVTSDPAAPASDSEFTVRVALIDAETRAPLPAGVSLPDGSPETMTASFFQPNVGVTTADLRSVAHGAWEGRASVFGPGTWTVRVNFPGDGQPGRALVAGTLGVE